MGNYIVDEPMPDVFGSLKDSFETYLKNVPGKIPYVTLFPQYAYDVNTYSAYVNGFVQTVKPSFFSCDIYPLTVNGGMWHDYAKNLKVLSDAAKKGNARWNLYIQSVSDTNIHPPMTARDFEWQAWNVLSFGGTGVSYFTYVAPGDWPNAILDSNFNKNPQYDYAKEVNGELLAVMPVMSQYSYLGTYSVNSEDAQWGQFSGQYQFDEIGKVESSGALLIGAFEKKEGEGYGFSCVNNTWLLHEGNNQVKMKTDSDVTLWIDGNETHLKADSKGYVSFELKPGQGAFGEFR